MASRRCMLATVKGEAAVELGLDAVNRRQESVGGEVVDEAQRGALRADRVRGRRSRADAEQLERAYVHANPLEASLAFAMHGRGRRENVAARVMTLLL